MYLTVLADLVIVHTTALQEASRTATLAALELKDSLGDKFERIIFDAESDDDDDESSSVATSGSESETERNNVEQLTSSLRTSVSCLVRLTPVLETACVRALSKEEDETARAMMPFRLHGPADHFIRLIIDRFKDADLGVANRLGEANWQRKERVQINSSAPNVFGEHALASALQIDEASLFKPSSTFKDSGLGSSLPVTDVASLFSSASSRTGTSARVPPTPQEVERGEPFECYICRKTIQTVKSRAQWK